jgi:myo-inositol-1(or 4)-monophosphatase
MNRISPNLNIMIKAAEKASKILIRDFGELENLQVTQKGPKDFVTNSDKKVEKILIEELEKYKKNYSFLSEENGKIENKDKENIWIIDPIDGTNNFLHGIPHFSISIGLKSKNEIIAGVIYDPIKNELFFGEKDNGAYINNHRIRVSKKNNLDECLFASNNAEINSGNLSTRNLGSAALDLAYVGSGRFDGYFQNNLNIWDIAAGIVILKEAGGMLNDINLSEVENFKIRASSNTIYEKMLKKLSNF